MIVSSQDMFFVRPIYALPENFHWQPRAGLTLVGDAAHLMPPLGLGVNLAMLDAAELAMALTPDGDWHAQVARQEAVQQERAHREAHGAISGFAEIFADDAPAAVLRHMRSHDE